MNKILLWIGISGGLWVPLHAASNGHNKKALVVAGYVREKSAYYMPPYLLDGIYRYWAAGQRVSIGEAVALQGMESFGNCGYWVFVPPCTLVEERVDKYHVRFLRGWDVQNNHLVFQKTLSYPHPPSSMLYIPHDQGDCVVMHYGRGEYVCFWLKSRLHTAFGDVDERDNYECFSAQLVGAPDGKGFVSLEHRDTIGHLSYWDVGTWKLGTCFNLAKELSDRGLKRLRPDRMVSFIDADRFALLASYEKLREGANLYVYHRKKKDLVQKVHVKMITSFDAYHFKASCWMQQWIIVPVTKGFWMYNVVDGTQSYTTHRWGEGVPYKVWSLDESQFVLITKCDKNEGTMFKGAICEIAKHDPLYVNTWDCQVLDDNVRTMWAKDFFSGTYSLIVLLGSHFILKKYWDDSIAVHPLT